MQIDFESTYDLESTLECGQAFRWRREGDWYGSVIFNNNVKIRRNQKGVEFRCSPDDELALEPLLRGYLRLEDDIDAIYATINRDEYIGESIKRFPGMRILRQEPWECLVSFICSANSNIGRISTNVEDISTRFGRAIRANGDVRHTFPTVDVLAEAGEQPLRDLGLGFRAKYVSATARIIADGGLDLYALREASYDEALESLVALPGIGDKVANCIMLFSLDKLEAFPVDVWIDRALREWYPTVVEKKLTKKAMRPWAQDYFGRYAGYANQYLFHGRRLQGKKT